MKPFTEERPWGNFREFTVNEKSTVKILKVNKGQEFSLQTHKKRNEFWRILSGHPDVTVGGEIFHSSPGEEFMVKSGMNHRVHAINESAEILEISEGDFEEGDIQRISDDYGRN